MQRGWIWIVLGGTLFLMLLAGGYLFIEFREARERAAWEAMERPFDDVTVRFPATEINEAALRLLSVAARMGIALAPDGTHQPPLNEDLVVDPIDWMGKLTPWIEGPDGSNGGPSLPSEVVAYLEARGDIIDEIETLLASEEIVWASNIEKIVTISFPRLLESRFLHQVLMVRALEHAQMGRPERANLTLEAAWLWSRSFRRRPELLCQLMAIAFDRMMFGVLRRIGGPPEDWSPRLTSLSYREQMLDSAQAEVWAISRADISTGTLADLRPYSRLSATNSLEVARRWIRLTSEHFADCRFDFYHESKAILGSIPDWNVVGSIALPSLGRNWKLAIEADLDAELTLHVLARRRWASPEPVEPVESDVCQGMQWLVDRPADGPGWTIHLSERPFFVYGEAKEPRFTAPGERP